MKKLAQIFLAAVLAVWVTVILRLVWSDASPDSILGVLRHRARPALWGADWHFPATLLFALLFPPLFMLCSCALTLRAVRKLLPPRAAAQTDAEQLLLSAALGMILIGCVTLTAGWIFAYLGPLLFFGVLALALMLEIFVNGGACSIRLRLNCATRTRMETAFGVFSALAALVLFVYCASPPIQSDGLRYHLAAPQEWLKRGRIEYLPLNAFSNFPFLGEMLYLFCMTVLPDVAAKLLHALCFLGTFAALWLLGRRICAARAAHQNFALLAPFLWLTTPVAYIVAGWEFIDHFTTLFFTLTVYCLARYKEADWSAENGAAQNRGWLFLAGIFAGAALSTKYTMAPLLLVLCGYLVLSRVAVKNIDETNRTAETNEPDETPSPKTHPDDPSNTPHPSHPSHWIALLGAGLREALLFGALLGALCAPWLLKNGQFTGNPIYPLAHSIFPGGEWSAENQRLLLTKARAKGAHREYAAAAAAGDLLKMAALLLGSPLDAVIQYQRYESQFPGLTQLCALPLLLLLIPALKAKNFTGGLTCLLLPLLLAGWLLWFHTYQSNRFLLPLLPLLCWLIALALLELRGFCRALLPPVIAAVVALGLFQCYWCLAYFCVWGAPRGAMAAALGFVGKDQYLSQLNYYPMTRLLPRYVREGERVLFVGEHRGYYFDRVDYVASDWYDTPAILWYLRQTQDNAELFARLRAEKIRWVFFNNAELGLYYQSDFVPRFTPEELRRFEDFVRSGRLRRVAEIRAEIYLCRIEGGG